MTDEEFHKDAGGNVSIGDVSIGNVSDSQIGFGIDIVQNKSTSIGQTDIEELKMTLLDFQNGISKLGLSSEDQIIVNGDISAAIKEAKKDTPALSKIKARFESAITTVKDAGKTIQDISELYEPTKKIAKLVGIGLSALSNLT